jgi:hypothetical protein
VALPTVTKIMLTDEVVGVTLVDSAARTASSVSDTFAGLGHFSAIALHLDITAASGTSPTLNLYFQNAQPNETDFYDIISFTQKTGTGDRNASFVNGGNQEFAPTDASLTAGTFISTLLAPYTRLKWVIGGTNPSFTFSVSAYCYR